MSYQIAIGTLNIFPTQVSHTCFLAPMSFLFFSELCVLWPHHNSAYHLQLVHFSILPTNGYLNHSRALLGLVVFGLEMPAIDFLKPVRSTRPVFILNRVLLSHQPLYFTMLSRLAWLYLVAAADAQVTVYKQTVLGMPTTSSLAPGATATYSGPAAFDPSALNPPAPPSPMPPLRFSLQLQDSPNLVQGLSSALTLPISRVVTCTDTL